MKLFNIEPKNLLLMWFGAIFINIFLFWLAGGLTGDNEPYLLIIPIMYILLIVLSVVVATRSIKK